VASGIAGGNQQRGGPKPKLGHVQCRTCLQVVIRRLRGDRDSRGFRIFVDDRGGRWNGLSCPSCWYIYRHPNLRAPGSRKKGTP
jgi:hypothetical protein